MARDNCGGLCCGDVDYVGLVCVGERSGGMGCVGVEGAGLCSVYWILCGSPLVALLLGG